MLYNSFYLQNLVPAVIYSLNSFFSFYYLCLYKYGNQHKKFKLVPGNRNIS